MLKYMNGSLDIGCTWCVPCATLVHCVPHCHYLTHNWQIMHLTGVLLLSQWHLHQACLWHDIIFTVQQIRRDHPTQWAVCSLCRGIGWAAAKLMKYTNRQGYYCSALYNRSYWSGCRIASRMAEDGKHHLKDSMSSATSVFVWVLVQISSAIYTIVRLLIAFSFKTSMAQRQQSPPLPY